MGVSVGSSIYNAAGIYETGMGGGSSSFVWEKINISSSTNDAVNPFEIDDFIISSPVSGFQIWTHDPIVLDNVSEFEIGVRCKFTLYPGGNRFINNIYSGASNRLIRVFVYDSGNNTYFRIDLLNTSYNWVTVIPNTPIIPIKVIEDNDFHNFSFKIEWDSGFISCSIDGIRVVNTFDPSLYLRYGDNNAWKMGIGTDTASLNVKALTGAIDLKNWYVKNNGSIIWGNSDL